MGPCVFRRTTEDGDLTRIAFASRGEIHRTLEPVRTKQRLNNRRVAMWPNTQAEPNPSSQSPTFHLTPNHSQWVA